MIKISTSAEVFEEIQSYVNRDVNIIDAVMHYAEINGIEPEAVGDMVKRSPKFKAKLRERAEQLNLVEKTIRLPEDV